MRHPITCSVLLTLPLILAGCGSSDDASTPGANGGVANAGGGTSGIVSGSSAPAPNGGLSSGGGTASTGGSTAAGGTLTLTGPFEVPMMKIDVANGAAVTSKEAYVACTVNIDGKGSFSNYSGTANIRGRGNSTWLWYDKKPYRIKLDTQSEILGLKENKDWVLLANYRDPTFIMNAFGFEVADFLGLPFTNHSRFVEVTLNGTYVGLYHLTEQIEQGTSRVDVADAGGILIALDEDDGPVVAPTSTDNFTSTKYQLPVVVKYPPAQSAAQMSAIKDDFAKVEQAIALADYDAVASVLNIASFIDFLIVQELTYNVELAAPRSMYLHKNPGAVYVMGPVWDFDGGFDFDWTDMMTSHDYFAAQELVLGADPARDKTVSPFWVNLFMNARFVSEFKARWSAVKDTLLPHAWGVMEDYTTSLAAALDRDAQLWPTGKNHVTETERLKQWLQARVTKLNTTIDAYPAN